MAETDDSAAREEGVDRPRLWYDDRGEGDPLVLLHPGGAGVDSRALTPQLEAFSQQFHVYTPEQRAHGRTPDVIGPLSYEMMAEDTATFIRQVIGGPVHLLGCSDGAVVALTLALRHPNLVRKLVFVAGVFHHNGWEVGVLEGEPPDFLRQSYGEMSPDGLGHYQVVVDKLAVMHAGQPVFAREDLRAVACPALVTVADDDEVRLEHAVEMYRDLAHGELAVVPGTSHGLLVEKPDVCNFLICEFLLKEPVPTLAPIRRATSYPPT